LEHQHNEAERQRQHELAMLDRQIQLEQMRQAGAAAFGPPAGAAFGPPGGPAFGAPPPMHVYDPALR
jgi:hypothetical protein